MDHSGTERLNWRKSSFSTGGSNGGGKCMEVAALPDGDIALRNSNAPEAGILRFARADLAAWLDSIKAGELDDLR